MTCDGYIHFYFRSYIHSFSQDKKNMYIKNNENENEPSQQRTKANGNAISHFNT